jgi:hypothetical protein
MIMNLNDMNEKQLRQYKTPVVESIEELATIINSLANRKHDYGTCVYAMSIAAHATFRYIANHLGVTGFQASCADLDFLRRTRNIDAFKIVDYSKVLYPQYHDEINNICVDKIIAENKDYFRAECKRLLKNPEHASANVIANWKAVLKKCGD